MSRLFDARRECRGHHESLTCRAGINAGKGSDGVGRSIGAVLLVIYGWGLQEVGSSRNSARNALRETTYRCALLAALSCLAACATPPPAATVTPAPAPMPVAPSAPPAEEPSF